jgi:hypothetical protein
MAASRAAETPLFPILTCLCQNSYFQGPAGRSGLDSAR